MQKDSNVVLSELRVDGGATGDTFLMQFQADIANTKVVVPRVEELSALGSANMAGLATGFWSGLSELEQKRSVIAEFVPQMDEEKELCTRRAGMMLSGGLFRINSLKGG